MAAHIKSYRTRLKDHINDLPKGTALKPWTGVEGLPKGIGPAAVFPPKAGVDVPEEEAVKKTLVKQSDNQG